MNIVRLLSRSSFQHRVIKNYEQEYTVEAHRDYTPPSLIVDERSFS
jgi:hypothetical protein